MFNEFLRQKYAKDEEEEEEREREKARFEAENSHHLVVNE